MHDLFSREGVRQQHNDDRVPNWVTRPMWDLVNYFDEVRKILEISMLGSQMVQDFPRLLEILGTAEEESKDHPHGQGNKLSITQIRARADFAKNEAEKGHPTLHAHALIAKWAALETFIEDLCVTFLVNEPELLAKDIFAKVKVPLAEFQIIDNEERCRFLLGEIERQTASRRHGTDRFEALLEPLGLSGPIDDDIKKSLYACHQIRNILVHRGSIVDRRMAEGCPWLGLKIGDRVIVTQQKHDEYSENLWHYSSLVIRRVRDKFIEAANTSPERK